MIQIIFNLIFARGLKRLVPLIDHIEHIYRTNSDVNDKYYAICARYGRLTQKAVRVLIGVYLAMYIAFTLLAYADSIWTGKLRESMHIYFSFSHGDWILVSVAEFIYNHAVAVMMFVCVVACDAPFVLIFVNILMTSAIVGRDLKDLDAMLDDSKVVPRDVRTKLKDYLTTHLKYIE